MTQKKNQSLTKLVLLAGAEGLEPSTKVLETHVLPLHHAPTFFRTKIIIPYFPKFTSKFARNSKNSLQNNALLKDYLNNEEEEKSLISFCVRKLKSADEEGEDFGTIVPFQVAYAVSIHKAQGLEFDAVKIVITDEVEELVTHNVFYTAITRAREKLKIYWTPEVEEKVINRIKPRDISKDVEILKNYLG